MDTSLIARGGVPVQLDRERIVFFNMQGTGLLVRKYGRAFWREIFQPQVSETDPPEIKDVEALGYALWAGLQVDAESEGETLTLDQTADLVRPMTVNTIANALLVALTFSFSPTVIEGKGEAVAASPAVAATQSTGRKASTTRRPRGSRSESSTGHQRSSLKPASRK